MKLRFGPGEEEGFVKLHSLHDFAEHADGSIEHIFCPFQFQRLTQTERFTFMNEAHRVLIATKQLQIIVPYWTSARSVSDPLAQWPTLTEASFIWYSRAWREAEQMTDLPLTCNFGSNPVCGHVNDPDVAVRNDDYRQYASKHLLNAVHDLHVTLTKLTD